MAFDWPIALATASTPTVEPLAETERIGVLDILRGLALLGMLMIHVQFGAHGGGTLGVYASRALSLLVLSKAHATFALLFGASFEIMFSHAEARGHKLISPFVRRLLGIAMFGAIAEGIFAGNVLMSYAVAGVWLLFLRRRSTPTILAALLLSMTLNGLWDAGVGGYQWARHGAAAANAVDQASLQITPDEQAMEWQRQMALRETNVFRNIGEKASRFVTIWSQILPTTHRPGVLLESLMGEPLTFFLMGSLAVRFKLFVHPWKHRRLIFGVMAIATALWFCSLIEIYKLTWPIMPVIPAARVARPVYFWFGLTNVYYLGITYVGIVTLLVARSKSAGRVLGAMFASAGRLALTNYMLHLVILSVLFEPYGFGAAWVTPQLVPVVSAALFAVFVTFSRWWLHRYRFGPAEWALRSMTYARLQPLRREEYATR